MKFKYSTAKITKIEQETPRVKTFTLDISVDAKPGQYVMLWMPEINEKPFGVAGNNPLQLSIANVGLFTQKVHALKVGDVMTFRGPYGSPFRISGRRSLLIGGGYGVVPLYLLAQSYSQSVQKNCIVIIGARTKSDLLYIAKFKKLGCTVMTATDDGSAGTKGFSTDLAAAVLGTKKIDSIYTCGPEIMMKKVARMSADAGILCQVSIERHFKCGGMGFCGSCGIDGKLACIGGPIFPGHILL